MAAHAATTKANSAHHAQGAAPSDGSGGGAELFADLLAKTSNADETNAPTNDDTTKFAKPGDILPAFVKNKAGKQKTDADNPAADLAQAQAVPTPIAVLNAKIAAADGDKTSHDDTAPVDGATDAAKSAANRQPGRSAKDDTDAASKAAKQAASDTLLKNAADIAATDGKTKATTAKVKDSAAAVVTADPAKPGATDLKIAANDDPQAKPADAAKTPDGKPDDTKKANTDSTDPTTTADKASTLAAAADKNVRQTVASQATQARVLPIPTQTQAAAGQGNGSQTGGNSQDTGQSPPQHTKADTNSQPSPAAVKPAADASPNMAATTQPASHAPAQTANVQPPAAPTQAQSSPAVAASLQVTPQTANQAAVPPDIAALAVQIAAKSHDGAKQFDIRLDPPELGRVDVQLSFDNDGRAQAHLTVEKPQTLDLMQRDQSDLQRALKDSGVNLSQNGLNFSLKGQERQGDNSAPFRGRNRNLAVTAAIETVSAAVAASTNAYAAGDARLDIRV